MSTQSPLITKFRYGLLALGIFLSSLASFLLYIGKSTRASEVFNVIFLLVLVVTAVKLFSRSNSSSSNRTYYGYPLLTFFISLIFYLPVFLVSSPSATDWSVPSKELLRSISLIPQAWESHLGGADLGHPQGIALWLMPIWSFISVIHKFIPDIGIITKLIIILSLLVGNFGIQKLLTHLGFKPLAIITGSLFYLTNTYILVLIDGGNIFLAFAYFLFPNLVHLLINNKTSIFKLSALAALIGFFDIRFFLIYGLLTLTRPSLKGILSIPLSLLPHLFWIMPLLFQPSAIDLTYASTSTANQFSFATVGHLLFSSQPHWYTNTFGAIQSIRWYFFPILFFVLVSLLLSKNPHTKFFSLLFLLGLLLAKGAASPFPQIYSILLNHLPLFSIFRDPSKFTVLLTLGMCGLLTIFVNDFLHRVRTPILIVLFTYFFFLLTPIYQNQMSGLFSPQPFSKDYETMSDQIESEKYSRILWIPTKPPPALVNRFPIHTEGIHIISKKPFLSQISGTYELTNFLRTPGTKELLDISGIKYIAYPFPDFRKSNPSSEDIDYYYWYNAWLANQDWLTDISFSPGFKLYKTNSSKERLFGASNLFQVVGTDNIYEILNNFPSLDLGENIIVHTPNNALGSVKVFVDTNPLDLFLSSKPKSDHYSLSQLVPKSGSEPGDWWSRTSEDYLFVKDYLKKRHLISFSDSDLGLGYAFVEGAHSLDLPGFVRGGELFVRVLKNRAGGSVSFTTNSNTTSIQTYSLKDNFSWSYVGPYVANSPINITSDGQLNLVNAFTILDPTLVDRASLPDQFVYISTITPESRYLNLYTTSKLFYYIRYPGQSWQSLDSVDLFNLSVFPEDSKLLVTTIDFSTTTSPSPITKQISQTKYEFTISNPGLVVFSESYNENWRVFPGNISPIRAYEMLNGYQLNQSGTYSLVYLPQNLVLSLFPLSMIFFILFIMLGLR